MGDINPREAHESEGLARRPLASRESRWAPALARRAVAAGLSPNQVSVLSILFAALAGAALGLSEGRAGAARVLLLLAAAAGIQLRLLCNLLDGLMAVEGGLRSKTGELYNDLPDRFSDALILLGGACSIRSREWGVELGWLATLFALLTAYVRVLGASVGAGHDFRGPMAKQQRMAAVTIACLLAIFEPLAGWEGRALMIALGVVSVGCVVTIIRRLSRLARTLEARA